MELQEWYWLGAYDVHLPDPIFSKNKVLIPGQITFGADVGHTKEFLEPTPLRHKNSDDYAAKFLARGLDAAKVISNAFNEQYKAGYKPVTDTNYGQDKGGSYLKYLNSNSNLSSL